MAFRFSFRPASGRKHSRFSLHGHRIGLSFRRYATLALLALSLCPARTFAHQNVGAGSTSIPCNSYYEASVAYNYSSKTVEFCNGTIWGNLLGANSGLTLGTSVTATDPYVTGDLTSGLFSAATSTVAIATGGTQQLTVNTTGVGIGSISPTVALDLIGVMNETKTSGGVSSTDGVALVNTTAAAAGAQQYSPRIRLTGQGWKTAATAGSQTVDWKIENQPVQGVAAPTTNLVFGSQINGGGYNVPMALASNGGIIVPYLGDAAPESAGSQIGLHNGNGQLVISQNTNYVASIGTYSANIFNSSGMSLIPLGFIGWSASTTPTGSNFTPDTLIGRQAAATIQLGGFDAPGSPTAQTFGVQGVHPGGGRTDIAGADWAIYGSRGLGLGKGGNILFQTAPAGVSGGVQNALVTAMTISGTNSYVGIGTTAAAEPLEIYSSGAGVLLQLAGSSGTCNHTPGSSSETVSCSSDSRSKSATADTPSALPWLSSIRVRDYTWNKTGDKRTGVIAQELQKTHPEMVTYDKKKDEWTVEQPNPWMLVKLLQEHQTEIDELKKQLATKH